MDSSIFIHPKLELTRDRHSFIAIRRRRIGSSYHQNNALVLSSSRRSPVRLLSRATGGSSRSDGAIGTDQSESSSSVPLSENLEDASKSSANGPGEAYIGLFVRMLGVDHDPLDREQAIIALWKYSQKGKHCIDNIMAFYGCVNLTVNLLKSDSNTTCEAAAGLLRELSSINAYKDIVAESGAIEELSFLLNRCSLTGEVKEQCICTLWNLSVDEKLRMNIANMDILPVLINFLNDEDEKVNEAVGGVLANLALSSCCHKIMVESGVIPKLAAILKSREGSKVTRKEAKNVLLELAKDEYYKILILEEGLVMVPMVGAASYKSFKPVSHSWPSLPDGTPIERTSSAPSRYGASELLLGLNICDRNMILEEEKTNAILGRTQQQFLARIGAIEMEEQKIYQLQSSSNQPYTLLPYMDGIARLVLILELEEETAIVKVAQTIADSSISEYMRRAFKEAGAVQHLVRLLNHENEAVRMAVATALERLSVSDVVCRVLELEGVLHPLVDILKNAETSQNLVEKTVSILAQIFDPGKQMKNKVNGLSKALNGMDGRFEGITSVPVTIDEVSISKENVFDSDTFTRLVNILETSSANLQKMVASILDFLAADERHVVMITTAGIESGLLAVFHQTVLEEAEDDFYSHPESTILEVEEAGLAISAASRFMTKLLSFEHFCLSINLNYHIQVLRKVLRSKIPLHSKDWVAACLVRLGSMSHFDENLGSPIDDEVCLYETIPRLVEQVRTSFSPEVKAAVIVELNSIVSKGMVDFTRAVAAQGGIFPLVKFIEEGSGSSLEAALAILFNLSMDSENHPAIISAGAIPILKRIVLSEGPQWMRALHLLRALPT